MSDKYVHQKDTQNTSIEMEGGFAEKFCGDTVVVMHYGSGETREIV